MSNIAIKVKNLSKAYQLGQIGTGTISRDLERWYARFTGKEDPFLRIGESNNQNIKSESDLVWSLKDINFEIVQGDAVGIIGRNGAGKSTLLKILSKVTAPTTGKISGKGRIASLLEVGTGFHPELSGRENIFLNGAILGMRKKEIQRKLEEIVDFAEIERYLDTPVKRYSSGMYVRLAFAVAAHLESEILIVDEVLAVGDAEFQKKCLGKMGEVSKGEGRTVLFVSHNMGSVIQLCKSGILLKDGELKEFGEIAHVVKEYNKENNSLKQQNISEAVSYKEEYLSIQSVIINSSKNLCFKLKDNLIKISITGNANESFLCNLELRIFTKENKLLAFYSPGHLSDELIRIEKGYFIFNDIIEFPKQMTNGAFFMTISLSYPNVDTFFQVENLIFEKEDMYTANGRSLNYDNSGYVILERYAHQ